MNRTARNIYVYADWSELQTPTFMGILNVQSIRRKEVFSFEFSDQWLKSASARMLDPDLLFYPGRQYADSAKGTFGIFLDSSPDRWGRQLMRRREAIRARHEDRPVRALTESDYLLEVHDETRMGALRFKLEDSDNFVSNEGELPVPPWTSLRELEAACRHYESEEPTDNEHEKWVEMLLAPGSSLGGARPKANVLDNDGNLWIAKFPSRSDSVDVGAWEMLAHELGKQSGLNLPECHTEKLSKYGTAFLTKRFDRNGKKRIHFASAMTLLGKTDGDNYSSGCSYLDLAQFIVQHGSAPTDDLQELWRRIIFSIAISNTDDHLRNHGFLLTPEGWKLSPAYDINPMLKSNALSLNISMDDNSLDFDLALSVAQYFRVKNAKAAADEIKKKVSRWPETAKRLNISRSEIENMSACFHTRA